MAWKYENIKAIRTEWENKYKGYKQLDLYREGTEALLICEIGNKYHYQIFKDIID